MDTYSGYNQIKTDESCASHTMFYADNHIYHCIVMPFRIVNVGDTYQRMVNKLFAQMIGTTMEL